MILKLIKKNNILKKYQHAKTLLKKNKSKYINKINNHLEEIIEYKELNYIELEEIKTLINLNNDKIIIKDKLMNLLLLNYNKKSDDLIEELIKEIIFENTDNKNQKEKIVKYLKIIKNDTLKSKIQKNFTKTMMDYDNLMGAFQDTTDKVKRVSSVQSKHNKKLNEKSSEIMNQIKHGESRELSDIRNYKEQKKKKQKNYL
jgi:hypothetical protein